MNNFNQLHLPIKTRQLLRLIWIDNQAFWIHQCSLCQKTDLERKL